MGVEQYGLGFRVTLGIFYEVEARGIGTKGNARGAQEARVPPDVAARQSSGDSSPWNCTQAPGMAAQAAITLAALSLTNSSTGVTKGGRRRASSAARCTVTARGLGA